MRQHGSPWAWCLLFLLLSPLDVALSGGYAVGTAHAPWPADRQRPPVPYLAACRASMGQHSALQTETAECQTQGVEARLPCKAFPFLLSRQALPGRDVHLQHDEAQGIEARPSPLTCQQARKDKLVCEKGWEARLPPHQRSSPNKDRRKEQAGRNAWLSVSLCRRARARPSPHRTLYCACSGRTALHPQMRWPFGIKEAIATQAVARHPCNPPAFATQSVAARPPTLLLVIAARGAAARLVTMSWLSRSDREMEEQIETALYVIEPWPRAKTGGRFVEVYSAGYQTMESRAGVHGTRPVERTDYSRGINLVNAADDALVKTAINGILPRANRNIATPASLVDARQLQDGGRVRELKKHSGIHPDNLQTSVWDHAFEGIAEAAFLSFVILLQEACTAAPGAAAWSYITVRLFFFCRAGRHRSVLMAWLFAHWLARSTTSAVDAPDARQPSITRGSACWRWAKRLTSGTEC